MEIKDLGHVVLYVRNLARSAAFYRDVLGFRQVAPAEGDVGDGGAPAFPAMAFSSASGRTHHELLLIEVGEDAAPQPHGRRVGLYHIGLKVGDSDDELREAIARVSEAGVEITGASDHTVTHSLYILDPDGNELELFIDVPGVDWRADPTLIADPIRPLRL
ncbi:MAG: VOC family protein [Acidimicrobiales bacterium]